MVGEGGKKRVREGRQRFWNLKTHLPVVEDRTRRVCAREKAKAGGKRLSRGKEKRRVGGCFEKGKEAEIALLSLRFREDTMEGERLVWKELRTRGVAWQRPERVHRSSIDRYPLHPLLLLPHPLPHLYPTIRIYNTCIRSLMFQSSLRALNALT